MTKTRIPSRISLVTFGPLVLTAGLLTGCGSAVVTTAPAASSAAQASSQSSAQTSATTNASSSAAGASSSARPGPGRQGAFNPNVAVNAAAQTLNMQPSDLTQELRSGKTLQEIAAAQNVDIAKVESAMTNAVKPQLDQAVQGGQMTSQQEQQILSRLSSGQLFGGNGAGRRGQGSTAASGVPAANPSAS